MVIYFKVVVVQTYSLTSFIQSELLVFTAVQLILKGTLWIFLPINHEIVGKECTTAQSARGLADSKLRQERKKN